MKKQVTFVDANKNKVVVNINIENGRFSMSGDMGESSGQCQDNIKPANEAQELLLDLWEKHHLNDMKAGTYVQTELLRKCGYDLSDYGNKGHETRYDYECWLLSLVDKLWDELPDGTMYKYGSSWLTEELPTNIEEVVEDCITLIEEYEDERRGDTLLSDMDFDDAITLIKEASNEDEFEVLAIAKMLDLTVNEIDDIKIDGNRITVQGVDYIFGTDSEMDDEWDEELEGFLEDCIYPELEGNLKQYFNDEAWKRDAKMDGRGHSLNRYDGGELYTTVDGVDYYAYRQ
jgi:hypothetical protein